MADLTADAYIKVKGELKTELHFLDTSTGFTAYKGQAMMIDQSVDPLNARPFVDAVVVDPTDVVLGIAMEQKTVVTGGAETTEIAVAVFPSIIGFKSAVFDNADLGKTVYMSDSGTLSETAADNVEIGTLFKVEDGFNFVLLSGPKIPAGA